MLIDQLIPEGIKPKLLQSAVSSQILSAARLFEEAFRLSGTPFFREYTDHSFQHCIDVFRSACDIVTDRALEVLSSEDLNLLLLSCMLHDSGLHTTEDVFIKLVDSSNSQIANPAFDDKNWPTLWANFISEASQ